MSNPTLAQKCTAGAAGHKGLAAPYYVMIEVDDSQLPEDAREFLDRWAKALKIPLGVLILRIVEAAIDGDQYVEKRPRD